MTVRGRPGAGPGASHVIEQTFTMGSVGSPILWGLAILGVATLINTFMMMLAGRWVTGLDVAFGTALGAVLLTIISCFLLFLILGLSLWFMNELVAHIAALVVPLVVPLVIQVTVIRWRLDVTMIGAILITLVMGALSAAVTMLFMGIFVVVLLVVGPSEFPIDLPQPGM
jgi:hypothetical protein